MPTTPQAEHPVGALAKVICEDTHARGVFLYIMEGEFRGHELTNWGVWCPPEIMAGLPEIIEDAANEVIAGQVSTDADAVVMTAAGTHGVYADYCEQACRQANARAAFVYVQEGNNGSNWSIFCTPEDRHLVGECVSGAAEDMKSEEPKLRSQQGLETLQ